MSRDELLVIFSNYAAPLHQRGGTVTTSETNKQQSPSAINPSSQTKRYFHSRIQTKNSNPSNDDAIDNVTSDCKKMKLHTNVQNKDLELNSIKTNDDRMLKRQPPPTTIMVCFSIFFFFCRIPFENLISF